MKMDIIIKHHPHKIFLLCLIILSCILVFLLYKRLYTKKREGFTQNAPFIIKRNQQIYDDFTSEIYDKIYNPKPNLQYIFDTVEKLTQSDTKNSVILDIGSGTGNLVSYIHSKGYNVFGIENSESMVEESTKKNTNLKIIQGDITNNMTFDKSTFTHIFMTDNTIYHFKDKISLFRNIYYWLRPNSYMIIELVEREKFDPIPPSGKPLLLETPQTYSKERIIDTEIDFNNFKYNSSYDFSKMTDSDIVVLTEKFTDVASGNVRKNELNLYMESLDNIVYTAQYCGFIVKGQFNLLESPTKKDKHSYTFIFERPY